MPHVVLLGDSIFDNAAYVAGGPAVVDQVRAQLPRGWEATLLAVDGSTTAGVAYQIARLPPDATHLVLSTGGNDALGRSSFLGERATSVADVFRRVAAIRDEFAHNYSTMLQSVLQRGLPTAICTIYDPCYPNPELQRITSAALPVFNDAILRAAGRAGLPVIDLRLVCDAPTDYANPIEPSVAGGAKIAARIVQVVTQHDFSSRRTSLIT